MAQYTSITTGLDELTTCPLCMEDYDSPRGLPCQHVFCLNCLDSHIQTSRGRSAGQGNFLCPMCRIDVPVPADGAAAFPLSVSIVSVQDVMTARKQKEISDFCKIHQQEKIQFYCDTCADFICSICLLELHREQNHQVKKLTDKNARWKAELDNYEHELIKIEEVISKDMSVNDRKRQEEISDKEKSLSKMRLCRKSLIEKINNYFDHLEESFCTISKENEEFWSKRNRHLLSKIEPIRQCRQTCRDAAQSQRNTKLRDTVKIVKDQLDRFRPFTTSSKPAVLPKPKYTTGVMDNSEIRLMAGYVTCGEYFDNPSFSEVKVQNKPFDTTCTPSGGYVVSSEDGDVMLYNGDSCTSLILKPPQTIKTWWPRYATCQDDKIIISNCVSTEEGGGLLEFQLNGEYKRLLTSYGYPRGVTVTAAGNILMVAGNDKSCWVNVYKLKDCYGQLNHVNEQEIIDLAQPFYVKENHITGHIMISHHGGVTALQPDSFTHRWRYECRDTQPGQLKAPTGLAITHAGDVIVADRDSGRLLLLSSHGDYIREYRMPGDGWWNLQGVSVDEYGTVRVVNYHANKLYIFQLYKPH